MAAESRCPASHDCAHDALLGPSYMSGIGAEMGLAVTTQNVGDLNRRRARIMGMESRGGAQTVKAEVPLSEMFGYSTDLRSSSQGRATFTMEYHHYDPVPAHIAESIATK